MSALDARMAAQRLAFGPVVFFATNALLELGLLKRIWEAGESGISSAELASFSHISEYGVSVLCESALSAGILEREGLALRCSKLGHFLLHDPMTRANFEFVRDVCYTALPALTDSIRDGKPHGLAALGGGSTIYETLLALPAGTRNSWLRFDHFYSDAAFGAAVTKVFAHEPRTILDVGANTGRFSRICLEHDAEVELWLVDHAPQLEHAKSSLAELGFAARVQTFTRDLLDPELQLPGPVNIVWLSQVLDCLPPANACSVLTKAREALAPGGRLFVLEPCTDLQPHPAGAFCLNQTSLYFACLANGTSRMYDSGTLQSWFAQTGFVLVARHDGLGYGHSLFECARAE